MCKALVEGFRGSRVGFRDCKVDHVGLEFRVKESFGYQPMGSKLTNAML